MCRCAVIKINMRKKMNMNPYVQRDSASLSIIAHENSFRAFIYPVFRISSRHMWQCIIDVPLVWCLFCSNVRSGWGLLSCVLISCAFVNSSSLPCLHAHPPLRLTTHLWFVILNLCLWGIRSAVSSAIEKPPRSIRVQIKVSIVTRTAGPKGVCWCMWQYRTKVHSG